MVVYLRPTKIQAEVHNTMNGLFYYSKINLNKKGPILGQTMHLDLSVASDVPNQHFTST